MYFFFNRQGGIPDPFNPLPAEQPYGNPATPTRYHSNQNISMFQYNSTAPDYYGYQPDFTYRSNHPQYEPDPYYQNDHPQCEPRYQNDPKQNVNNWKTGVSGAQVTFVLATRFRSSVLWKHLTPLFKVEPTETVE